jgi:hypothetical protein
MRKLLLLLTLCSLSAFALDATEDPPSAPSPTMYRQDVPVVQPSRIGAVFDANGITGAFTVSQGAELKLADWFKLGGDFAGTWDYDHKTLNGPLVARDLNPGLFAGFTWKADPVTIAVPFGWGEETNGEPLRTASQWNGTNTADEIQDLAHFGVDYYWAKLYISNTSNLTRHEISFNGSIEYRYFANEIFGFNNGALSDKAVFVPTSNPVGYQHYDGIRASIGSRYEWFALQLSGKIGTRAPANGSFGAMISADMPEELRKTFPIAPYASLEYGYGLDLARYFQEEWKVSFGLVVRNPVLHAIWD